MTPDPLPITDGRALWAWIHRRPDALARRMLRRALMLGRRKGFPHYMRDWTAAQCAGVHTELQKRDLGESVWGGPARPGRVPDSKPGFPRKGTK